MVTEHGEAGCKERDRGCQASPAIVGVLLGACSCHLGHKRAGLSSQKSAPVLKSCNSVTHIFYFLSVMLHQESSMKQIERGHRITYIYVGLLSARRGLKRFTRVKPCNPYSRHLK